MAKILVVIEEPEEDDEVQTYHLEFDGDEESATGESAELGVPLDFDGRTYLASADEAGEVTLHLLTPVTDFEAVADDDDSDEEGDEEESEDEEEAEPIAE
jgi:hypothetical protein